MIIDPRQGAIPAEIECDLSIFGGGAAGLTVARELTDTRFSICLLEGGGRSAHSGAAQRLAGRVRRAAPAL